MITKQEVMQLLHDAGVSANLFKESDRLPDYDYSIADLKRIYIKLLGKYEREKVYRWLLSMGLNRARSLSESDMIEAISKCLALILRRQINKTGLSNVDDPHKAKTLAALGIDERDVEDLARQLLQGYVAYSLKRSHPRLVGALIKAGVPSYLLLESVKPNRVSITMGELRQLLQAINRTPIPAPTLHYWLKGLGLLGKSDDEIVTWKGAIALVTNSLGRLIRLHKGQIRGGNLSAMGVDENELRAIAQTILHNW